MSYGSSRGWLTGFQRASIFAAVMLFVAFAMALSIAPVQPLPPENEPHTKNAESKSADHRPSEFWRQFIPHEAVGAFTLGLMLIAGAQALMFFVQLRYMNEGLHDASVATQAAQRSANAAQESAKAASASNRPWLRISTEPNGQLIFGPEGVSLETRVFVENVGRSPAVRVKVSTGIGITNSVIVDGAQWAVNKAQISVSERITYDRGRTSEELARIEDIGDVVFPGEQRPIETIDHAASRGELFGINSIGDDRTFDDVFYAVSSEYRIGSDWGVTTVVYAIEKSPNGETRPDGGFRVGSGGEHKFGVILRKLQIYTTAT
jgi:hypothetical protein